MLSNTGADASRAGELERGEDLQLSLIRGIAWTGAAKSLIQAITWVGTIVIAHYLTPDDYGIVQLALVFLNLLTQLNEFSIGFAIVTLRDLTREQIAQLNGVALLVGAVSTIVACAAAPLLGHLLDAPRLPALIALLSPMFALTAARTVPQSLLQKELRFRPLALIEAGQALVGAAATLLLALFGSGYFSLALGRLVSVLCWTGSTLALRRHSAALPRVEPVRHALRFSVDLSSARLAWYAYANFHFLIVGHYLGTAVLGAFTIAWTLAHMAADRVAALLVGVVPSYLSLLSDEPRELRRYFLAITEALALAVLPIAAGTSLIAADFVPVVLGERWALAVAPLQILPIYAAFFAISSLLAHVLRALRETRFFMICNIATAIAILLAVRIAVPWGLVAVSWVWVTAYPLLTLPLYVRAFQRLEVRPLDYWRALSPAVCSGAAMVAAVLLCGWLLRGAAAPVRLLAMTASGALAYPGVALCAHGPRVRALALHVRRAVR